ncbi:MAG: methyl-accepting chemotaxis protein [Betaproteobacteria bacterium]|nr:methyl-accepting chemotaxis protein [Betaproteobacteria bacterium]
MFANAKVATRLVFGFGLTIALMLLVAVVGGTRMEALNAQVADLGGVQMKQIEMVGKWEVAVLQSARHMRNVFLLPEGRVRDELDGIRAEKKARAKFLEYFAGDADTAEAVAAVKFVSDARSEYLPWEDEFLKLASTGQMEAAKAVMLDHAGPTQLKYAAALAKLREHEIAHGGKQAKTAAELYAAGRTLLATLSAAAILAALAAAFWITISITRQLGGEPSYAARIAAKIAGGDLSVQVSTRSGDSESVLAAMKKMRDDLAEAVAGIRQSANGIGSASRQIASGNADLSSRTEEQASTLEQTASSMEELTTTVKQNAESASQANQLASSSSEVAMRGGRAMDEVVATMRDISDASQKIGDIIAVIDSIAFQTNILALNAAVEAARAGEQGRGFAVVASEVRALAQRSAGAAKEIKDLIQNSNDKVTNGSQLVQVTGTTIDELVVSARRVTDVISEIAAASQEQLQGIEQVNRAMAQMDQVVQQNAALVEQSAAATEELAGQSDELVGLVARFKLEDASQDPVPSRVRAAARAVPPARGAASGVGTSTRRAEGHGAAAANRAGAALAGLVPLDRSRNGEGHWKEF